MTRTQLYLTEAEASALKALSRKTGLSQSELMRRAVDEFIERQRPAHRRNLLKAARGMWRERTDLPNLSRLRREWDRSD